MIVYRLFFRILGYFQYKNMMNKHISIVITEMTRLTTIN